MTSRQLKAGCFVLEGLNIYAAALYFNYLFFYLKKEFGFGDRENLLFAAANGFLYIFFSWFAGTFAQRRGYYRALFVGFGTMTVALGAGCFVRGWPAHLAVMLAWTVGLCFTWPVLEALASEGETRAGLTKMIGIYNVVWAGGAAFAYFSGGALLEALGPRSLYWFPAVLHALQFALALWLDARSKQARPPPAPGPAVAVSATHPHVPANAAVFLKLAWLANPFAYIAMNTVIPLIPELAMKMNLSTTQAGFVASVWMFARLFAFIGLWAWPGWHYRFGWLAAAYAAMVVSFAALLLVPDLAVIVAAQLIFGLAVGLIYYSSLFYSMDVGDTKGEHGGFHEALIGVGLFGGPAAGAAALHFVPGKTSAGIWAVSALLVLGLFLLWRIRPR